MRISKKFGLNRNQAELDFVDINTSRDIPLFIDPHFLGQRTDRWSELASHTIRSFFSYFIALLASGRDEEAGELFDNLHEPNETCLGLSKKRPDGNGVGEGDARRIFQSLAESKAAKTGILEDLEDCRIFVRNIDKDKLSDMTTNIIRSHLITYTENQCDLWGIPLTPNSPSGFYWNPSTRKWDNGYTRNLHVGKHRILLVPKAIVSYSKAYTPQKYHQHFVLNFLQHEHLRLRTALVRRRRRKDGSIYEFVTKKDLVESGEAPPEKDFLATFTKAHPDVFVNFKTSDQSASQTLEPSAQKQGRSLPIEEFVGTDIDGISTYLQNRLRNIPAGIEKATDYHRTAVGILEFLSYPNIINPLIEQEIHDGRKRIDIVFDNAALEGFFHRLHAISGIACPFVLVECKNYSRDPANPELDQIAGRFNPNRGQLGLVVCRAIQQHELFLARCRDTFRDGRGLILPLTDEDFQTALRAIATGVQNPLEDRLADLYRSIALP